MHKTLQDGCMILEYPNNARFNMSKMCKHFEVQNRHESVLWNVKYKNKTFETRCKL